MKAVVLVTAGFLTVTMRLVTGVELESFVLHMFFAMFFVNDILNVFDV